MTAWLASASHAVALAADAMALVMIACGSVQAFAQGIPVLLRRDGHLRREVWIRFGRWMVAALGFQLAADIGETSVAPTWDEIGRLGAIAVIRTFLEVFLQRDLTEAGERGSESARA
jgi:uncharacterized membrane protein